MAILEKINDQRQRLAGGRSFTLRLLVIGFLMLIFIIPTKMVQGLVTERALRQEGAVAEVSSKWGESQTMIGPILVVPYYPYDGRYKTYSDLTQVRLAYFLPESLNITGPIKSQIRQRGIYKVALYEGDLQITGKIATPDLAALSLTSDKMFWDKAYLVMGGLDFSGLKSQIKMDWDGIDKQFVIGGKSKLFTSEVVTPVTITSDLKDKKYTFSFSLQMRGSGSLFFVPIGKETKVSISSDWANPSFDGAFLPSTHSEEENGFKAEWQVLDLSRSLPSSWVDSQPVSFYAPISNVKYVPSDTNYRSGREYSSYNKYTMGEFGVRFYLPVDIYQKNMRSAKYAMSVIGLVFLIFFLVEAASKRRVNPLQYILVGLALCIFYTLLLSLSEYIAFGYAYLIASAAIVAMIGLYARSVLDSSRLGFLSAAVLVFLYGFVYILLQSKDYTLLIGSIGLFIMLGVIMYFSRYVNWCGEVKGGENSGV